MLDQPIPYHYSAFRANKDGQTTWFDGVVSLNVAILTQEQYLGLKKLIAEHYDIRESNLVISSLTRMDMPPHASSEKDAEQPNK